MSNIKNKINFFENLLDKNNSESSKNKFVVNEEHKKKNKK